MVGSVRILGLAVLGALAAMPRIGLAQDAGSRPATSSAPAVADDLEAAGQMELSGKYEEAAAAYRGILGDATAAETKRTSARLGEARCLGMMGRYGDALKVLEAAPAQARNARWHALGCELLGELGRHEEAIAAGRAGLAAKPRDFQAAYWTARRLDETGRRDELLAEFAWIAEAADRPPQDAAERTWAGLLLQLYAVEAGRLAEYAVTLLHEFYQPAYETLDRRYWPARIAAARLLAESYNMVQAKEDFSAALKINPACADALVGLAVVDLDDWKFEQAEKHLKAALKANPAHGDAHETLASLRMIERKYEEAARQADEGLRTNPRAAGLLSVQAAAYLRMGKQDRCEAVIQRVKSINPRPWRTYHALGEWLMAGHQYDAAETHYRQANELAPHRAEPLASLGMMYMQIGKEKEASEKLEAAFEIDNFNRKTYNTLKLLDELHEKFAQVETEHFIIRFDPRKDAIIGPTFSRYLERVYGEVCGDYGHQPARKTIIEVFPSHDQFSVRITALPWIGTVGASTGPVIAMTSPRPQARGAFPAFNWARVLKHEFTHTVTLGATGNRIPHWFTEGLAVHGEAAPRPWSWTLGLARMALGDKLFTLESIDWAFVRPKRPTDREMAYAQSEWMCEFLVERFGFEIIQKMLNAYLAGKTQEEVFVELAGGPTDRFDKDFAAWARKQADSWNLPIQPPISAAFAKEKPSSDPGADELAELAAAMLQARHLTEAEETARKALEKDAGNLRALETMGLVACVKATTAADDEKPKYRAQAAGYLTKVAEMAPKRSTAPKLLGELMIDDGKHDEAIQWLRRLKAVCPLDPASYKGLAGIYMERSQPDKALPELLELARGETEDARLLLQIADIYQQKGQLAEARHWLQEAAYLDPFRVETHAQLAEACLKLSEPKEAVFHYELASQLAPQEAAYLRSLAEAYRAAGQPGKAEATERRAANP